MCESGALFVKLAARFLSGAGSTAQQNGGPGPVDNARLYWGMSSRMMAPKRAMLSHFLAALAYRTQKALRGAPAEFAAFSPGNQTRTPKDLLRHMSGVLG